MHYRHISRLAKSSLKLLRKNADAASVSNGKLITPNAIPLDKQSVLLPGPEKIRSSPFVFKSSSSSVTNTDTNVKEYDKTNNNSVFLRYLHEESKTLYEAFRHGARLSNNGQCLGWRENPDQNYKWLRYNEVLEKARNFGCGLCTLGLKPGSFVGINAQNCPHWVISQQGMYSYSMVTVPLYDTLGLSACSNIIREVGLDTIVCDVDEKVKLLMDDVPPCLNRIIHIKPVTRETLDRARKKGVELISFEQVEQVGFLNIHKFPEKPPSPDDLCLISYTSGTTGNPKGVMLSHENVVAVASCVQACFGNYKATSSDVMISFLPLAHIFEFAGHTTMFMAGGSIGFFGGDVRKLMDDMKALQPTVSLMVPRVLNRIYDTVTTQVSDSLVKRTLLQWALGRKEKLFARGILRKDTIWDKFVLQPIQQAVGGKLRLIVTGSAPISGKVLTFARSALSCLIIEGYGQTECASATTFTIIGDNAAEHVGCPIPSSWIKLVDVPQLNYFASQDEGEICIKGSHVFKGYFKDPEQTKATIDEDGWLHTGDIGRWLKNGTLKIIDRKKYIFKLSHGEYVAPEKIENVYVISTFVLQVFLYGDPLKSSLVAIVVPDPPALTEWAKKEGVSGDLPALCRNERVRQMILENMNQVGVQEGLMSFEQVKDIYLECEPFSVQNGLLTPTFKSKRPLLKSHFKPQLEDMLSRL